MSQLIGPIAPSRRRSLTAVVVWAARVAWLAVAVVGGSAIGDALDGRSRAVQVTGTVGAWAGWAAGAAALAVAGVATLTLARAVVPGSLVVAATALAGGADAGATIRLVVPATVATALVSSAEFGRVYIQASAYGDEQRFGLRPPLGYLLASGVTWVVTATAIAIAPVAVAGKAWLAVLVATPVAAVGAYVLPRRWHQLSRRWFVIVPAGLVLHDPVVLADTLMMPRRTVSSVRLDEPRSRLGATSPPAADLTGPTAGLRVEIELNEPTTATFAATPSEPRGRSIHLTALVFSPTRPGSVIRAVRRRGYA